MWMTYDECFEFDYLMEIDTESRNQEFRNEKQRNREIKKATDKSLWDFWIVESRKWDKKQIISKPKTKNNAWMFLLLLIVVIVLIIAIIALPSFN